MTNLVGARRMFLIAAAASAAPIALGAQSAPTPCTSYLLIAREDLPPGSPDTLTQLVSTTVEALVPRGELFVVSRRALLGIFQFGDGPPSTLMAPGDWRELAKQLRANLLLLISENPTRGGRRFDLKLAREHEPWASLPPIDAGSVAMAAKIVAQRIVADTTLRRTRLGCPPRGAATGPPRTSRRATRTW